jgi:hypothetical protein
MSRMPPGFGGGGYTQNVTVQQANNFEVSGQTPSSQANNAISSFWGPQQRPQNNSMDSNSSSWNLDANFSSLGVGTNPEHGGTQPSQNSQSNAGIDDGERTGKAYNYAAAAASGASNRKQNVVEQVNSLQPQVTNSTMNHGLAPHQQQFSTSWMASIDKSPALPSGPNPLSQLAAQQKELIKLQENLMQMMQSQANAGFKDPQVFMDLQRQQAIATAQLQSMQDAFRVQQQTVPSFPNQQISALGSWPLRQSSAPMMLGNMGGTSAPDYKGSSTQRGQTLAGSAQESSFYRNTGPVTSRNRFNSSNASSAGYDSTPSQTINRGSMTYGAVVAGAKPRGNSGVVTGRVTATSGTYPTANRDKRNEKRNQLQKTDGRRSVPEIPNETECIEGREKRTTLMIRNIPNKYTQTMLLEELNEVLHRKFDFFYLPIDFRKKTNMGYAFINMIDPIATVVLVKQFHGKGWRSSKSEKICQISYARIQGKHALVEQFRNSTVMSKKKQYRPIIFFSNGPSVGTSEPFPPGNSTSKQRA